MAVVTQLKNGSYSVFWGLNIWNVNTQTTNFQCVGRQLDFTLSYIYNQANYGTSSLSVTLKTTKYDLQCSDYPKTVTAFLDSQAKEMTQPSLGQWGTVTWNYNRNQVYVSYNNCQHREAYLNLILDFPPIGEASLVSQLSKLLENQTMVDVQFVVQGQEMAAHAAILASASPVMATMLEPGKFEEGRTRTVHISDIDPEVFQQLLRYIYTGSAPKLHDDLITESLFLAADKYEIDNVKADCEDSLISKLKPENAVKMLVTAHLHSAPKMKEASIQCLVKHREDIWDQFEWMRLITTYPDLFFACSRRMVKDKV